MAQALRLPTQQPQNALIGLGFAFVGVAITLPIVGHASWHAYRELVVDDRIMTADECDLPVFPYMKGKLK